MRWGLGVFALVLVAVMWAAVLLELHARESREIAAMMRENANLARALEEHTTRTLQSVHQIALLAKVEYERSGAAFDIRGFAQTARLRTTLVLDIFVADETGRVVLATEGLPLRQVSHRQYFQVHRERDTGGPYLSPPFFGNANPRWVMPVSLRVNKPDGAFGGTVVVAIDPHYFADFYRSIDLRRGGVVTLAGTDGIVRARLSDDSTMLGQDVRPTPLYDEVMKHGSGSFATMSSIDRIPRIYGYRRLADYPLFLVVGTSEAEGLAVVRQARESAYATTAAGTALILGFTAWVIVLLTRQRRDREVLRANEQKQKALLDSIADAAWFKDASGRFIAVNRAFRSVFGVPSTRLIGRTNRDVFDGTAADTAARDGEDRAVLRSRRAVRCEYEIRRGGESRWVETIKVPIVDADGAARGIAGTARDVTERRRLDEALAQSEERLRRALRHANIGMWDWDVASDDLLQTERVPALLGLSEAAGRTTRAQFVRAIHPEDQARVEQATATCLRDGSEYAVEYRIVRPDGCVRWLFDRGDVVRDAQGVPRGMSGVLQDVTQRRAAEDDLRASESYFRTIFEQSAIAMTIVAPDGSQVRGNAALSRLLGYGSDEMRTMSVARFTHPDDLETTRRHMQEVIDGSAAVVQLEKRYVHASGAVMWGLLSATLVRDAAGRPLHFVGQVVDVTARRSAEIALREAEARFRVFVENMQEAFWIATPMVDRVLYLSPAFEAIYGIPADDVYRDPMAWRRLIHPEDASVVDDFVREQRARRRAECELRIVRPDGALRWLFVRSIPWADVDGTPLAVGVADDITSRRQQQEDRVRAAERQRDALVMEVHHRIKNNLQGVVGLLRQHGRGDPAVRELLDGVATQIHSIALVHGMQGQGAGASVDLPGLVRLIAAALEQLGAARIEVGIDGPPAQLKPGESVPVALILNELMWNAIKHGTGDRCVRVDVAVALDGAQARVEVSNPGAAAPRMLEDERGDATSGLGLVQALMPRTGASLVFEARDGLVRARLDLGRPVLAVASAQLDASLGAGERA